MGTVLHLSDVTATATGEGRWQALNHPLGVTTFGVNAVIMDPGEEIDIEHDETESGHQEVYVVVKGRAAFRLGDAEVEAGPGDVVAVADPAETRSYRALEPGSRIVCFGAGPGAEHAFGAWIEAAPS
jgi:mannose-6-phosphate isomerase-like protein (cupin superfamily)